MRCHHRAATWLQRKLHSAGTCRAGEPVRRAPVPHVSQSWKDARRKPHRCRHRRSRREAPVEPKIHRSNATSHESSQRVASRRSGNAVQPDRCRTATELPRQVDPPAEAVGPIGPAPQRPSMLPPKRTRLHASVGSTTKPLPGTAFTETVALRPWRPPSTTEVVENEPQKPRGGCPITDVFGRLRPKPSPTSRTNYQTVARSA